MKNILLVVDMQKGFTRNHQTKKLEVKIKELIERDIFDVTILTQFKNENNSIFEKLLNWHSLKTNDEQEISNDIMKKADLIVEKNIYNCVSNEFLQKLYSFNDNKKPEQIFIAGVDTDCCVLTIATSIFENGIRPIVLTNYCASNGGDDSHNAGILCMRRIIGKKQLSDAKLLKKDEIYSI